MQCLYEQEFRTLDASTEPVRDVYIEHLVQEYVAQTGRTHNVGIMQVQDPQEMHFILDRMPSHQRYTILDPIPRAVPRSKELRHFTSIYDAFARALCAPYHTHGIARDLKPITLSRYNVNAYAANVHITDSATANEIRTESTFIARMCLEAPLFFLFEDWFIYLQRPAVMHVNPEHRLHHPSEPAIIYRNGKKDAYWQGTPIPAQWLTPGFLTPEMALNQANLMRRQVACEIVGWANILKSSKSTLINAHEDPAIGTLYEMRMNINNGMGRFISAPIRLLHVRCGTGRDFALMVPPTCNTALEANAWTYGIDPEDYRLEVRT